MPFLPLLVVLKGVLVSRGRGRGCDVGGFAVGGFGAMGGEGVACGCVGV